MTTEAVKADAGAGKTQTEVQGAQSEAQGLDALLAEFSEKPKTEPKTEEVKTEPAKASDRQVLALEAAAYVKANTDFEALVKDIADETGMDAALVRSTVVGRFQNPTLNKAWMEGSKRTDINSALKKELVAGVSKAAAKLADRTSDRVAARASARVSPGASDEPKGKPNYQKDPAAFQKWKRENGFAR